MDEKRKSAGYYLLCRSQDHYQARSNLLQPAFFTPDFARCKECVHLGTILVGICDHCRSRRSYAILVPPPASPASLAVAFSPYPSQCTLYGNGDGEPPEYHLLDLFLP